MECIQEQLNYITNNIIYKNSSAILILTERKFKCEMLKFTLIHILNIKL